MSVDLAVDVYGCTKGFPKSEMFGLTSQMRRSAVSISANIAEGYGREVAGSYAQFLRIAQGSLKELETHVIIAQRIDLLHHVDANRLLATANDIGKMLGSLIRKVVK